MTKALTAFIPTIAMTLGMVGGISNAAADPIRFAMHDMMPMQQNQTGMRGGMGGMQTPGGMQQGPGMEADKHQQMRGMQPGMTVGHGPIDLTDRIEGRIAFLRAELAITDAQTAQWNSFADSLRSARKHLVEARQALTQAPASGRLEQYEKHLTERLQALKETRLAYQGLYGVLNEHQKHTAEELIVPFIATF